MKRHFWQAVHAHLPCRVIHLLCSECRKEALCPKCIEQKFIDWHGQAVPPGHPLYVVPLTFSSASTYTMRFPKEKP